MTDAQGTRGNEATPLIDKLDELRTDIIDMRFQEITEARLLGLVDSAESLSRQALAAQAAEHAEYKSAWLAMVREIANLDEVINPDDAMGQADDDTLLEHFDPWQTLREVRQHIAEGKWYRLTMPWDAAKEVDK